MMFLSGLISGVLSTIVVEFLIVYFGMDDLEKEHLFEDTKAKF